MHQVVISVGSNIEPLENIARAREIIRQNHRFISESGFTRTKPIGFADQPDFYNGAFLVDTDMSVEHFRKWLKKIENELGRIRTGNKYGPRTIDLDIAVWDNRIIDPDVCRRDFLKKAVKEICPNLNIDKCKPLQK